MAYIIFDKITKAYISGIESVNIKLARLDGALRFDTKETAEKYIKDNKITSVEIIELKEEKKEETKNG